MFSHDPTVKCTLANLMPVFQAKTPPVCACTCVHFAKGCAYGVLPLTTTIAFHTSLPTTSIYIHTKRT